MIELILFLILLAASTGAEPVAPAMDAQTKSQTLDMADEFASCAGVWDFVSKFEEANQRPASAEQASQIARGAVLVATYLASMVDYAENPKSKKKLSDFIPSFEGRRETSYTAMIAMTEREDVEGLKLRMTHCGNLLEIQEDLITELRRR